MNIFKIFLSFFIVSTVNAADQYTIDEVNQHNTVNNCWVIYDSGVYDLTEYLPLHDRYLNIREWCGSDMTIDFETKAGIGEDHKGSSYQLLSQYYIGELISISGEETVAVEEITSTEEPSLAEENSQEILNSDIPSSSPYELILPLILTLLFYWIPYFFIKNKRKFNAFWNTILLLTLLIPSLGFGVFMILRYQFPNLYNIDFDFMYWHVELSIVMGVLGISHLIQRLKMYLVQFKK